MNEILNENKKQNNHGPNKIAHLQMIQGVVDRMGGNLFYLKGWVITLLAGIFVVSSSLDISVWFYGLFIVLLMLFWYFDGYFLSLERCFRDLYDKVRKMHEDNIDFSMNIGEFIKLRDRSPFVTMLRPTLFWFYSVIILSMLIIIKITQF